MNKKKFFFPLLLLCLTSGMHAKKAQVSKDTISFIYFNDFHGSFVEDHRVPGIARFVAQVLRLKESLPNPIVLSGGDNYSGGFFPRVTEGRPISEMFETCGVAYSAIGNHEFDWGVESLAEHTKWGETRYLAANILYDSSRQRPEWALPYALATKRLRNGTSVRLAFIGLTTQECKTAVMPSIVRPFDFADPILTASEYRKRLADSADMFFLLTHIGTQMQGDSVVFLDRGAENLSKVPGIAGIFTGHSHEPVCGKKDGVPVIQAFYYGRKIGIMQYEVNRDRKGILHWKFLGNRLSDIGQDICEPMQELLNRYLDDPRYGFNEIICRNVSELSPEVYLPGTRYSLLGTLVTQSYEEAYRRHCPQDSCDIILGVCNWGAIRTSMPQGEVSKLQAGNILPFGGRLDAFVLNGSQLKSLLQYGFACPFGWLQYHNMEIGLRNGKIDSAVYVRNGKRIPVEDTTKCIVITESFVSSGGDGYDSRLFGQESPFFKDIPDTQRNPTDIFLRYLKDLQTVSAEKLHAPALLKRP